MEDPRRSDLEAAVATRRALGPEVDDAVLDSFLRRVDAEIAEQVDRQVTARLAEERRRGAGPDDDGADNQVVLGLASLGLGIPISAIAVHAADVPGLLAAWVGIVGVNIAHALSRR